MTPLLLTTFLFTSIQFCSEMTEELQAAVERQELTQQQADTVSQRCLDTYTKGR